jgi:hypothetical protein
MDDIKENYCKNITLSGFWETDDRFFYNHYIPSGFHSQS